MTRRVDLTGAERDTEEGLLDGLRPPMDMSDWGYSARPNMVFGMFEETFFGVGKDGNHPSWTLDLSNLRPNE